VSRVDRVTAKGVGAIPVDQRLSETQAVADPDVRRGLKEGLAIIRREKLARNEPFDPTQYSVTGFNEAGDPVINKVPNLRLLDAGKLDLSRLVGRRYRLEDINDAIDDMRTGRLAGRAMIVFGDAVGYGA
jgi:hypothetical protein